jgi:hypothetical protein
MTRISRVSWEPVLDFLLESALTKLDEELADDAAA